MQIHSLELADGAICRTQLQVDFAVGTLGKLRKSFFCETDNGEPAGTAPAL
jgi:hypothetical protein